MFTKEAEVTKDDAEIEDQEQEEKEEEEVEEEEDSGDEEGDVDGEGTAPGGKRTKKSGRRRRHRPGEPASKTRITDCTTFNEIVSNVVTRRNRPRLRIDIRPTALPRLHALDSAAATSIGRTTPHASPR